MTERKRARATWINVYEWTDGTRRRDRMEYGTRKKATAQARAAVLCGTLKLLYRIRVRRYLEPKACTVS